MVVIIHMGVVIHTNPVDFNLEVEEAVVKEIIRQVRLATIFHTSKYHLDLDLLLSIKQVPPSIIKCTT